MLPRALLVLPQLRGERHVEQVGGHVGDVQLEPLPHHIAALGQTMVAPGGATRKGGEGGREGEREGERERESKGER